MAAMMTEARTMVAAMAVAARVMVLVLVTTAATAETMVTAMPAFRKLKQ